MTKSLNAVWALLFLGLATAVAKPHAVIVVGTHHYSPQKTMPEFAAELERLGFRTTLINPDWDPEKDKRGLPGLEALASAEVVIFFTRFLKLEDAQLGQITRYVESGKPVVGLRTSTHAFNYPAGHPRQEWNTAFGRDVLGTPYLIHLTGKTQVTLQVGASHPILTGVEPGSWESPGTLYLVDAQPGIEPLLVGTGNSKRTGKVTNQFGTHELQATMTAPIAWTWKNKWGGRVFTTSLGHAGDFDEPKSLRVMLNGVFWAAGQDVPSTETAKGKPVPRTSKKKPVAKKPAPKTTALADTKIESGGMTLFYGNSFVERLQEDGSLEALLQVAHAGKRRQYRSLAYTGDEVGFRIRPEKFGDHLDYIASQLPADQVVMCFGMNEAFAGAAGIAKFAKTLEIYLSVIKDRHPRAELVLVSPTAVETPTSRNADIASYCQVIKDVAAKNTVKYIDLFTPSKALFAESKAQLTINGLHLNAAGNWKIAQVLASALAPASTVDEAAPGFAALRDLVSRKAYEVAMAYHPANGIHYYGVRSRSYEYATEIPHHLKLANILDAAIWKQAADLGKAHSLPTLPTTKAQPPANKPRRGLGVIKTAKEDLADFTVADGFELNLFASSEDYPELINPLQINFDSRGRLWVACFASYPVPIPGELSNDTILIFEDTDGDGQADKRTVFADKLKLPDGFVFYRDGIIVSVSRKLIWLRDTDGDDVADVREEMLRGADDTDTHHGGYLARTPQGHVIYCEALFHRGQFETPQGPLRTKDAAALYLDPVTRALSIQRQTTHPNPWKISYNRWGESMQMFGGGQIIDCDFYDISTPVGTSSSGGMGMPFRDDKGCTLAYVSSPHFPKEWQGGLVTGHLLGKNTVLYTPLKLEGGTYVKAAASLTLLSSSNKVFRPTDLGFGLDGALYIADFYYPIIGHAQHSIRDANRDYANGRIWRMTRKGVDLAKAPVIDGAPLLKLFELLTHPQVRVRELAREELERRSASTVLAMAKSKVGAAKQDELLGLELLWLFERAKDYTQADLYRQLVNSDELNIRRAAARSLRWWTPTLGAEAKTIAAKLVKTGDERLHIAVVSVASYLQAVDPTWRQFIDNADATPGSPLDRVKSLASLYDTPPLNPEFPLLKVDPAANLSGWLMNASGHGGSLIVKSAKTQDLVLGHRNNAFMNLNLNNIPLLRATGSLHTKNGQINVTLHEGMNKIEFCTAIDGKSRPGKADLYLANLIGHRAEGLSFAKNEAEHSAWTAAYDDENATVTDTRIRLKAVPSKMAYNMTTITVKPGHRYQFVFENPDHMLHNLVITKPGKASVVGELVDAMAAQPDAMAKHFIPETNLILFATPQIPYGGSFEKEFTTPSTPGRYPYICSFPGHWRLMSGVMIVKANEPVQKATPTRKPVKLPPVKSLKSSDGVVIETASSPSGFKTLIPPTKASGKVTANSKTGNSPLSTLTDGKLAKSFGPIFRNGVTNGAYKMDLGALKPVRAIQSWSVNQTSKRGPQRIRLFGSKSAKDPGWNLSSAAFTPLGNIDTTDQPAATFTAASLTAKAGQSLGEFRWIVWQVLPITELQENTAFQELAVETGPAKPAPPTRAPVPAAKPQSGQAARVGSPNIVFIYADDMGYGDVQCLNPERGKIPTPRMDQLAKEGMHFTDAHTTSSVCTPSRYGLLTGRYNWRTHLQHMVLWGYSAPLIAPDRMTVAGFLKTQGYDTAAIGKWHLGMTMPTTNGVLPVGRKPKKLNIVWDGQIKDGPTARGFDHFWGISASLDMAPYAYIENDRFLGEIPNDGKSFTAKGFDRADVLPGIGRQAAAYIQARKADTPFFVYVPLTSPHTPIVPNPEWIGKSGISKYADFQMQTDDVIGKIIDAIDAAGHRDNTLIIVSSDNGCSRAANFATLNKAGHYPSAQFRGSKADLWDGGHRVPFIARWPGIVKPGSTSHQTICLTDLIATCADIVKTPLPGNAGEDSVSFLPALKGKPITSTRAGIIHHSIDGHFAYRQGKWKLLLAKGSGGWTSPKENQLPANAPEAQLYDMEADPGETQNLYISQPEFSARLLAQLESDIKRGRSTAGPKAKNDTSEIVLWKSR